MQDSSAFQYIAIDQIFESSTNPRQTFDPHKLDELAASIRQHGVIQPVVVRPKENRFELVAGARRFRASRLAEQVSIPAHIRELTDAEAVEWQLVENSQRVDVHPYEEAQGFQRLLDMPGYDVSALAVKTGKSASHIYARLSLLQLIPDVAQAFVEERITASHANLIARLPEEHQAAAFEQCWRKDWQDKEAHLLPSKHLSAWIETNLYLALADAPFDREDISLNAAAGACVTCPRRSGYNTSLFADVNGDQCLDGECYQSKVAAHIDRELAAQPQLVQIETAWRTAKDQRPGTLSKYSYRVLDTPENPDAEPACPHSKAAMIVFGREAGTIVAVCTDMHCSVHDPAAVAGHAAEEDDDNPVPVMEPVSEDETEEEAEQRRVDYERRRSEQEAETQRREEERKAEFERQQKEREAELKRREKIVKARSATLDRILDQAPVIFNAAQLRIVLRLLIDLNPYSFLEDVAGHFAGDDENTERTEEEIVLAALGRTADDKLTSFALRLLLSEHVAVPREGEVDLLSGAEAVFAASEAKAKPKKPSKSSKVPELVKTPAKKSTAKKQKAA